MQNHTDRQRAWFRALDHARLTGVKPTYVMRDDCYRVTSPRTNQTYVIRRVGEERRITYTCTCPAAVAGNVCWHRALVMALPYEIRLRKWGASDGA
jgi:hypothetical protein